MSHVNNMHTWMTPEDFAHCDKVLHAKGGEACFHAEVYCIRKRKAEQRAEEKRTSRQVSLPLFGLVVALVLAMLSGCSTLAQWTAAQVTGAVACAAGAIDDPVAAVIARAGCWLEAYAAGKLEGLQAEGPEVERLTPELDAAVFELEHALVGCDDDPTQEQAAAVSAALAVCEGLVGR